MGDRKRSFHNYHSIIIFLAARFSLSSRRSTVPLLQRPRVSSRTPVSLVVASPGEPSGRLKSGVHLSTGRIEKWLKHQSRTRRSAPAPRAISTRARVFHCYYFHPDRTAHPWSSSSFVVISLPLSTPSSSFSYPVAIAVSSSFSPSSLHGGRHLVRCAEHRAHDMVDRIICTYALAQEFPRLT